ncbi:protein disulfide-isomerase precursor [Pichia californica]|uniref:Protein disulfide-isomerase n=1 Tax=Pichia californica TaxID=460514 RepID=A0A9P7BDA8_9ASCO|nr:protein disulfide-isomerase precursor [[Candida] californica]KAG0687857.1 protein disulfide-isomerase precursor [[Candida] californica]
MQFSIKTVAAILTAITNIATVSADGADGAIASPDSAVVKLTEETFHDFIASNPYVLAEFFAPWCGHCKKLGPEFASAADTLVSKNPDIKLAQIDCTEERDLCAGFEIRGYPTMKIFKGDVESVSDYAGQRQADGIVNYMVKLTLPAVQSFDEAKILDSKLEDLAESLILQILPNGAENLPSNETFYKVADRLRESFTFGSTSDESYVSKYVKGSSPAYVIFRKGESIDDASVYKGKEIDEVGELLYDFIDVESKPLFGEINGQTYQSYTAANIPLAYYFYNTQEERDAADPFIKKLGRKYRGEINFVGLDASQYGMHAQNLNMQEEFPLFVIHDLEANKKYGMDQSTALDNNDISQFVQKFKAGKLEPIVKSEPIPESQNSTLYHLVGAEHDAIVKSNKDVFVKYFAPWCGHCKKLAPIFEELSSLYEGKDVIIAEVDHTLNDVEGVDIKGYPTLVLFPADGSDPIYYDNERSLEAMADFIKENGSLGIDILTEVEEEEVAPVSSVESSTTESATSATGAAKQGKAVTAEKKEEAHDEL